MVYFTKLHGMIWIFKGMIRMRQRKEKGWRGDKHSEKRETEADKQKHRMTCHWATMCTQQVVQDDVFTSTMAVSSTLLIFFNFHYRVNLTAHILPTHVLCIYTSIDISVQFQNLNCKLWSWAKVHGMESAHPSLLADECTVSHTLRHSTCDSPTEGWVLRSAWIAFYKFPRKNSCLYP